jgi:hypothetical protein
MFSIIQALELWEWFSIDRYVQEYRRTTISIPSPLPFEIWMVTSALKISVVSSAFLIAIGWADRTVHIKNNLLEWFSLVYSINPLT